MQTEPISLEIGKRYALTNIRSGARYEGVLDRSFARIEGRKLDWELKCGDLFDTGEGSVVMNTVLFNWPDPLYRLEEIKAP